MAALEEIDADVFGLIEIQNDEGEATEQIVDALNAATAPGTYDFIDTGYIGTDAIKQAFVYKTAHGHAGRRLRPADLSGRPAVRRRAQPAGADPDLRGELHRRAGDRRGQPLEEQGLGLWCGRRLPADGSGNCDATRTEAAEALADHLATDPTGTGDSDTLIIGDLNSYAMERPIAALLDAGYTDLLQQFEGPDAYTYLFDGQLGTLDYGLANDSLADQVTGAGGWTINADENPLFDYNDTVHDAGEASFERESTASLYEPTAYRASDHDPVIIGLDLGDPRETVEMDIVELKPSEVEAGKTRPRLEVEVEEGDNRSQDVSGVVRVTYEDEVRTETLQRGKALFELGTFDTPGEVIVNVEYLGSGTHAPLTETFTFDVRPRKR